jgi:hypothetical protein
MWYSVSKWPCITSAALSVRDTKSTSATCQ